MYSYEDRIRAVKFYITCGYNAAYTVSKLGYPDASNLKHWYKEYSESNDLHKGRKKVSKFSDREKRDAVDYYFAHDRNALQTVKALGYPSRPLLIQWVKELCPEEGKRRCKSFKSHVRCSQEEKIQAVMESCKGNLKIAQIAEIYGVTPSAVSIWRKELLGEGKTLKMIQPPAEDKSIEQLMPKKAKNFSTTSICPFKIAFQTVPTTAFEDNTGIKITIFANFPSQVLRFEAMTTDTKREITV